MNILNREIKPGEELVISAEYMRPEYQPLAKRIFIAKGGFGMKPYTAGGKIFGCYKVDGEESWIRGNEISYTETIEWQAADLTLVCLDNENPDNPVVKCPRCGHTARLSDGFSLLKADVSVWGPDDADRIECGQCQARLKWT